MEWNKHYTNSQLEAIQSYYNKMNKKDEDQLSLTDAIISWFTDGPAEKFREEYLKKQSMVME